MSTENKQHCLNCGHEAHCEGALWRTEYEMLLGQIVREYQIEVCRHCRCGVVETNDNC